MKTFPALVTSELLKSAIMMAHLYKLEATATYYWTDCSNKIYFDGNWWTRFPIEFADVLLDISGSIPSLSIRASNVDYGISGLALTEELRGCLFTLYTVMLDSNLNVIGYAAESEMTPDFKGYVDHFPSMDEEEARIEIVSHRITERGQGPKRNHSPKCQWIFKHAATKVLGTDSNTYTCIQDVINHAANRPITGAHWADYFELAGSGGIAWVAGALSESGTCRYAGAETWCDYSKARCITLGNFNNFGGDEFTSELLDKPMTWGEREKNWGGTIK